MQNSNTRRSRFLRFKGLTLTMKQWSRKLGFGYVTLKNRLDRGWTVEEALTTPIQRRGVRIT
jgi:hypothetical protein